MWGSSFADLAKKAQELQEQASGMAAGELFNLDAMQPGKPKPDNKQPTKNNNDSTQQSQDNLPKKASFPMPSLGESAMPVATPKVQIAPPPKGKLKIVKKKSPKLGAVKLTTNNVPSMSLMDSVAVTPATETEAKPMADPTAAVEENQDQQAAIMPDENDKEPEKIETTEKEAAQPKEAALTNESEDSPKPVENTEQPPNKDEVLAVPPVNDNNESTQAVEETKVDQSSHNDSDAQTETKDEPIEPSPKVHDEPEKPADVPMEEEKNDASAPQPAENTDAQEIQIAAVAKETEEIAKVAKKEEEQTEDAIEEAKEETKEAAEKIEATDGAPQGKSEQSSASVAAVTDAEKPSTPSQSETIQAAASWFSAAVTQPSGQKDDTKANAATTNLPQSEANDTAAGASSSWFSVALPTNAEKGDTKTTTETATKPPTMPASAQAEAGVDSDQVMQQFTGQLQRLEANFELERKEMQQEHSRNLAQAIASKEQEMEEVRATLKAKDLKVRELKRVKEGNELRMDSLKREVQGIKELLKERDNDIEKTKDAGKMEKEQLEQKIRAMELEQGKTKAELKALQDELLNSRGKLGETSDEYTNLKSRVKVVAGELKDRRAECRELKSKIEELEDQNAKLQDQVSTMGAQLSDRDRCGTEKDEEATNLRFDIEQLQRKLKEGEKHMEEKEEAHEKNLASYKKKAQNSLAVANARAAAAIQSKEEAELEARAARSTADSTFERAKIAEANGQKAMVEAKEYYKEMEQAKIEALKELETAKTELESTKNGFKELQSKCDILSSEKERLGADNEKQARDIEGERSKASNLQNELSEAMRRASSLQGDVKELRGQLQKAEATAAANAKNLSVSTKDTNAAPAAPVQTEDNTSKATIMMLQEQLQEANQTIGELKDALENAVEMSEKATDNTGNSTASQAPETNGGNGRGAPLFYAMEKQAELNTARNEINRLASLYADVHSEKVEAQDELQTVRRELDEERARSQRHEKLGSASEHASGAGSAIGNGNANGPQAVGTDSGRTNIEYLKNIMMSYLNAKTLTERKSLVPVIGAVLCLTPDEQAKAIQNIESTGGMEGFGAALFESIGSKVR